MPKLGTITEVSNQGKLPRPPAAVSAPRGADLERQKSRRSPKCFRICFSKCCAWTSLCICLFFLTIFILAVVFISVLQSGLPVVHLTTLSFPTLNAQVSGKKALLDADTKVVLEVKNENDIVALSYSPMRLSVSTDDLKLGETDIPGFFQSPNDSRELKAETKVKSELFEEQADELDEDLKSQKLAVEVILSGKLSLDFQSFKVNSVPVLIACPKIRLSDLHFMPKCKVKTFSSR